MCQGVLARVCSRGTAGALQGHCWVSAWCACGAVLVQCEDIAQSRALAMFMGACCAKMLSTFLRQHGCACGATLRCCQCECVYVVLLCLQ